MNVTETDFLRLSRRVKTIEEMPGAGGISLSEVGAITLWPMSVPPESWLLCDGSEVSRAVYPDLFNKLCSHMGSTAITSSTLTLGGHGFLNGDSVYLTTTGVLPAGLAANTLYYVRDANPNTFCLSAARGGAAINTSGPQSGMHSVYACPWGISSADTFNLPNLKGKVAVGKNSVDGVFDNLGETGGEKAHALTAGEIAAHNHAFTTGNESAGHTHGFTTGVESASHTHPVNPGSHDHTYWGGGTSTIYYANGELSKSFSSGFQLSTSDYNYPEFSSGLNSVSHYHSGTTNGTSANHTHSGTTNNNTGTGASHNNLQPYVVLNFIIRYQSYAAAEKGDKGDKGEKGDRGEKGDFAPAIVIGYSANEEGWHQDYTEADDYIRFSVDGGNVWGGAIYIRGREGEKGIQGEQGASYRMLGEYDPETVYVNNAEYIDTVTYNGSSYYAKQSTVRNLPTQTAFWGVLARKGLDGAGTGDVTGPAANTDGYIPLWNGDDSKTLGGGLPQSAFAGALWGTHAHHQTSLPPGVGGAYDNISSWADTGFRTILLSANMLLNQPSEQGMLLSFAQGEDVHQLWLQQPSGAVYHRSGSSAGWAGGWIKIWDGAGDGTGSQLDADLLDGVHSSSFATAAQGVKADAVINGDYNITVEDTRNAAPSTDIGDRGVRFDFKQNSADGLNDGGTFHGVMTLQQWNDSSGGCIHAVAFADSGHVWHRKASIGGAWGSWYRFWDTYNLNPAVYLQKAQVRTGQCTLNSSDETAVSFASPNMAGTPKVTLTPNTSASSVIAVKVRSVSSSGFSAIIGGSGFSNIVCDYIAVYLS